MIGENELCAREIVALIISSWAGSMKFGVEPRRCRSQRTENVFGLLPASHHGGLSARPPACGAPTKADHTPRRAERRPSHHRRSCCFSLRFYARPHKTCEIRRFSRQLGAVQLKTYPAICCESVGYVGAGHLYAETMGGLDTSTEAQYNIGNILVQFSPSTRSMTGSLSCGVFDMAPRSGALPALSKQDKNDTCHIAAVPAETCCSMVTTCATERSVRP
jgi:hypothetical protein